MQYSLLSRSFAFIILLFLIFPGSAVAQDAVATTSASSTEASTSSIASEANEIPTTAVRDITRPEELDEKVAILSLFESRKVDEPNFFNFMAFWVQQSVAIGVPANTIFLILLTPILATLVSFTRVVVGLPTLDMLVPIALAFAFVAVGIAVGALILGSILLASYLSKKMLSGTRIMFYPKRSLSMVLLAIFVFMSLTLALQFDLDRVLDLSIFPILILILLGDSIVSVQLHKSAEETFLITGTTIGLGLLGYALATSTYVQDMLILYPEILLLSIPVNLLIGRYFGLRVLEYFRFNTMAD